MFTQGDTNMDAPILHKREEHTQTMEGIKNELWTKQHQNGSEQSRIDQKLTTSWSDHNHVHDCKYTPTLFTG